MQQNPLDWEEEYPEDTQEKYQSLVNSIAWTSGFTLLFVSSTPAQGEEIIERVKKDLPQKEIEVLNITEAIDNLYDLVAEILAKKAVDVLFIIGLEYSIYEYELIRHTQDLEYDDYDWRGVPKILSHLNQRREQFRDNFPVCFVFMLRTFSVKYFIHRAPDFFDWLSSLIVFPSEPKEVESESSKLLLEGGYDEYLNCSDAEREAKIIEIQSLLDEEHQTQDGKANLWFELGFLLNVVNRDKEAIKSYDQALHFQPDFHKAWYNRGYALGNLGRYEEAIKSYDQALHFQPNYHLAWYNRGYALDDLGRYEEAIKSYDQALHFQPDYHQAWSNRGYALGKLGRYEEAIKSYDQSLHFQPDKHEAWNNRGNALGKLGRYEEAIKSYDQALHFKPDYHEAWYNRGVVLDKLGRYEEAINSYDQALHFKPDDL